MALTTFPKIQANLYGAGEITVFEERTDLIVGQINKTRSPSSMLEKIVYDNVQNLSISELDTLLGPKTEFRNRVQQYLDATERQVRVDVVGVDEPTEVTPPTSSIDITGTASEDGQYIISVVDEYQYTVTIAVDEGDVALDLSSKISAAFGVFDNFPCSISLNGTEIEFASKDTGAIGSFYSLQILGDVAGLTPSVAKGSYVYNYPAELPNIFENITDQRYTGISWPCGWFEEVMVAGDFLEERYNPNENILDGVVFTGTYNSYANLISAVTDWNNRNVVSFVNDLAPVYLIPPSTARNRKQGAAILKPAGWCAAYFMGIRAKRLTEGLSLVDDVTAAVERKDRIGGAHMASFPYANTVDRLGVAPRADELFSSLEQQALQDAGLSIVGRSGGGKLVFGPVVTTYKKDSLGQEDKSFKYLNYIDTGSVAREIIFNIARAKYAQSRLTDGDIIEGYTMQSAAMLKATLKRLYNDLAQIALLVAGTEAQKSNNDNTFVTIDKVNRSAIIDGQFLIVTQLEKITYNFKFKFSVETGLFGLVG